LKWFKQIHRKKRGTYYSPWATSSRPISGWAGSPKLKQRRGMALAHVVAVVAASGSSAVRGGGGTALERYWDVKNPFWGSGEE
jgi:hypothetical protein